MAIKKKKIEIHLLLILCIGIGCSNNNNFLNMIINNGDSTNVNFEKGKEILDKSNLKILSATDLNDAAKKIVKAIN